MRLSTAARALSFRAALGISGLVAFLGGIASAQSDLPPVAAPTSTVSVSSLPIIRTESQQSTDFARGLLEGLMARDNITAAALVLVSGDRVDMAEGFGADANEGTLFSLGTQTGFFAVLAALQLVEQVRIRPSDEVSDLLEEDAPKEATLEDLLTGRYPSDPALLSEIVGTAAGLPYPDVVSTRIFSPLGMTDSIIGEDGVVSTTASDMSQLLLALVNGGEANGNRILLPATVDLMMRTQFFRHHALPGSTFGFAEFHRNGWRGLERDGAGSGPSASQNRLVVIPESQTAYFLIVDGEAPSAFWRAFDDGLFARLAPRRPAPADMRTGTPGIQVRADELVGMYRTQMSDHDLAFLKFDSAPLYVERAGSDLVTSGAETLLLHPAEGGLWQSDEDMIPAAFADGVFQIGDRRFVRVPSLVTPVTYLVAAGIFGFLALLTAAGGLYALLANGPRLPIEPARAFGIAGLAGLLALAALILRSTT